MKLKTISLLTAIYLSILAVFILIDLIVASYYIRLLVVIMEAISFIFMGVFFFIFSNKIKN